MKNKSLALVLAIFVMATITAWAQIPATGAIYGSPTGSPTPSTTGAGASLDVLGGHGSRGGCVFCHTPHSTGRTDTTAQKAFNGATLNAVVGNTLAGGFTDPFIWQSSSYGNNVNANIYLWNRAITTTTFRTWDGANTFNSAGAGPQSPQVHTLLCLTCHDNSMSTYAMTLGVGTQHGGWGAPGSLGIMNATGQDPAVTPVSGVDANGIGTWGEGTLGRTHPVHMKYDPSHNWKITINASNNTVSYVDQDTNQIGDSGFYGHPGRLYSDGTDAYVECTSCHNPHRQTSPAYKAADGHYIVGAYGTTESYIRGPYSTTDGTISAGFCRSCHYSKSPEYVRNGGVAK